MSACLDETQCEIAMVHYFRELGYEYVHGPVIAPDGEAPERSGNSGKLGNSRNSGQPRMA